MRRVALATSEKYSDLTNDDRLLVPALAELGYVAEPAVWNDAAYPWGECDLIVIRSCWDYHLKPKEFLAWLESVERTGIPIFNTPALVRWNLDKIYLRDLQAKGVEVVPTLWPEDDQEHYSLKKSLAEAHWKMAVVKPRISATAYKTALVSIDDADGTQGLVHELRAGPGVMVQKFMDSIVRGGEWSLMFFSGNFSHAVLKKATHGDFRVQNDFGGTFVAADPPAFVSNTAQKIISSIDVTLYARVDGVIEGGRFFLMELEVIEPALYLGSQVNAPLRFAQAIDSFAHPALLKKQRTSR
jgi:glutathione synthase/RimK-type ligase-like ATP-grasp enzyme